MDAGYEDQWNKGIPIPTDETKNFFLFVSNRYIYDENSNNTIFYCFIAKYIVIWLEIFSQLVTSTSHDI